MLAFYCARIALYHEEVDLMSLRDGRVNRSKPDPDAIARLIRQLGHEDGLQREKARNVLVDIGHPATESLIGVLRGPNELVRWEAAKALSQIADPQAAPSLVRALEDSSFGVRWLAAEGLISTSRAGLLPLLEALVHHSDSAWLREGAHHILRTLATEENLHDLLAPVLLALNDTEPALEVPPAAQSALDELRKEIH
jgi:HEAT repeat protein